MTSRFQSFSSVAAADRKRPFGPVTRVSNGRNQLGYPRTGAIHRDSTSATPESALESAVKQVVTRDVSPDRPS